MVPVSIFPVSINWKKIPVTLRQQCLCKLEQYQSYHLLSFSISSPSLMEQFPSHISVEFYVFLKHTNPNSLSILCFNLFVRFVQQVLPETTLFAAGFFSALRRRFSVPSLGHLLHRPKLHISDLQAETHTDRENQVIQVERNKTDRKVRIEAECKQSPERVEGRWERKWWRWLCLPLSNTNTRSYKMVKINHIII